MSYWVWPPCKLYISLEICEKLLYLSSGITDLRETWHSGAEWVCVSECGSGKLCLLIYLLMWMAVCFPISLSCWCQPATDSAASEEKVRRVLCSWRSRVHGVGLEYSVDVRAIGVNSYWAQGLKPTHFYDHGARLYDEPPPTFVTWYCLNCVSTVRTGFTQCRQIDS